MRIGKYELEECLGGGMSWVYRARDTVIGRTVAVKVLKEQHCSDKGARERFLLEAQVSGNLAHENVVRVFDFGEDDQARPYMVMEYLPGMDLSRAIREGRTGDLQARLRMAAKIAAGIDYIHQQGIIHRDIKPDNVSITERGEIKLMDFGIAKMSNVSLTQAGFTVGTPPYMAPEQIRAEPVTAAVDVYAFGLLLFELVTGKRAFEAETFEQIFFKVITQPVDCEALRHAGASEQLCALVGACTAKVPSDRPQTFAAVREALDKLMPVATLSTLQAPGIPAESANSPGREAGSKKWILGGTAAAVVLIAGGAAITIAGRTSPGSTPSSAHPAGATASQEWPTEVSNPAGSMVLVPAGSFQFGKDRQTVSVPAFYVDRTEVTNAAYSVFCSQTGRPLPPEFPKNSPDLPVVNVSFEDAAAFAASAGKRLPTSQEWEKAARGTDGRMYPWGNSPDFAKSNVKGGAGKGNLLPVNTLSAGASPVGAVHMTGNVWEFVDEMAVPSARTVEEFARSMPEVATGSTRWVRIRGGSYIEPLDPNVMWDSSPVPAKFRSKVIGFRCVRSTRE